MLACAFEDGEITSNPASGVRYVPTEAAKQRHPKRQKRTLTGEDVVAILNVMPEGWRAFFTLLAQSGVRVGELLGLTWANVHLGDDPHIAVVEQIYRGRRKRLKTDASMASVPVSQAMASWLTDLRPADASPEAPVFPSRTGTPLSYPNMYRRVLLPALIDAGIAPKVGERTVRKRGEDIIEPVYDTTGVGFHAFRKACGSLLLAHGKNIKQVQGWLRHAQLTTTMNVYMHPVDDGLGSADVWDEILPAGGATDGATDHPETAANGRDGSVQESPV